MTTRTLSVLMMLAAAQAAVAQNRPAGDSVLKGATIEVIQAYKPKIKPSPKPEWIPQPPPADTTHPVFNYEVPQQTLYYTYNSLPLQPLALGKMLKKESFSSYTKLGGGNISTIFLDAGIGSIRGKDYETAIHVHHISQNSNNIKYQQSALSGIEAEAVKHNAHTDMHALVSAQRNQYNYYGYDHTLFDYSKDSVKQTYTSVLLEGDLKNREDSTSGRLDYNPRVFGSFYNARVDATELAAGFDMPLTYRLDSTLDLKIGLNGALARFSNDSQGAIYNNFIAAQPGLAWHASHIRGHALLGLALGKDNQGYILPDVLGEYFASGNKFVISAGWKSRLRQNTYEQLSSENPYMLHTYNVQQMRNDEVFGRFQGRSGDHFSFTGHVSWWRFVNMPVFLNDFTTASSFRKFNVLYLDLNSIVFGGSIRYHVADKWSAGASAEIYSFFNITDQYGVDQEFVWHVPSIKVKGDFMINLTPKLAFTAYIALLGGIHAIGDATGKAVNLSAITDVGGNAEYQIVSRLSVFAQVNNLLNNKYQRWLGYEAYGLNIYGGLRLKF